MGSTKRRFRRFGQLIVIAAALALLCAAGLPNRGHVARTGRSAGVQTVSAAAPGAGHVTIYPGITVPGAIPASPQSCRLRLICVARMPEGPEVRAGHYLATRLTRWTRASRPRRESPTVRSPSALSIQHPTKATAFPG